MEAPLLIERAQHQMAQGNMHGALETLRQALSFEPEWAFPHALLALVLISQKRIYAAAVEADLALSYAPTEAFSHYVLAQVRITQRRFKEALSALDEAQNYDPTHPQFVLGRAHVFILLNKNKEAREALDEALRLDPNEADTHALYGDVHRKALNPLPAEASYRKALELEPSHPQALAGMGQLLLDQGAVQEARDHALWILQNDATDASALRLLTAVKAKSSFWMGLWWRFNNWVTKGSQKRMITLLVGMFFFYRLFTLVARDLGYSDLSDIFHIVWLGFVIYTWVGPAQFKRSLEKELSQVRLRSDF